MKQLILSLIILSPLSAQADFVYCTGEIVNLIARNSSEATEVQLRTHNGVTGHARIAGENGYNDYQKIQISMLLSAFMANKPVTIELHTRDHEFTSCTDFQRGLPIRHVRLRES